MQFTSPPPTPPVQVNLSSRVEQRRLLNCVNTQRDIHNLCWWNMPSCLEHEHLLYWIKNRHGKLLDVDALERLANQATFYNVDLATKRPVCLFDYRHVKPTDIVIIWDWEIRYRRKPGESKKTEHPELVALVKSEFFAVAAKAELLYKRRKSIRPVFVA